MKAVIAIVLAIALMIFLGWMTVQRSGDRATVTIETQKMQDDAEKALEKGRSVTEEAGKKTRAAVEKAKEKSDEPPGN